MSNKKQNDMKTIKLNQNQEKALVKCLKNRIELYDIWIENIKNSFGNQSNLNLAFESNDKYQQKAIDELKIFIATREELNSILNKL
jgi:hypothetical protein